MNPRIIDLVKNAKIPIQLNTTPGDEVLIVADTQTDPLVWQALAAAAVDLGVKPTVTLMTPRAAPSHEPTNTVAQAMLAADLVLLVPSVAMAHSKAAHAVKKQNGKIMWMEEITAAILAGAPAQADYEAIDTLGERLITAWTEAKTVHVTSPAGTDLKASVDGRLGRCLAVKLHRRPDRFMTSSAFPDGETPIAPVEGSGNGVVVFDGTVHGIGIPAEPIRVTVKDGRATAIEGGQAAAQLRRTIEMQHDENSYNFPAEIAIGLNPNCGVTGVIREDKKAYGAVHVAFGTNADFGGQVRAKIHIDGIVLKPTVYFDERLIVDVGQIVI